MSSITHLGLPMFHLSLAHREGVDYLGVGALYDRRYRNIPGGFHEEALVQGVDGALERLVAEFDSISGPFSGHGDKIGRFHLGALVGCPAPVLVRRNKFIRLLGGDDAEIRFGSESVIVIEVLVAFGNELADRTESADLKAKWKSIADRCDVLPMEEDDWFAGPSREKLLEEAEWYASHLGQEASYYVDAARWLRARQVLFAMDKLPHEPTGDEYDPSARLVLPSAEEIDALVSLAITGLGGTEDEFFSDSVSDRNTIARSEVVFRRWYGDDREDVDEAS